MMQAGENVGGIKCTGALGRSVEGSESHAQSVALNVADMIHRSSCMLSKPATDRPPYCYSFSSVAELAFSLKKDFCLPNASRSHEPAIDLIFVNHVVKTVGYQPRTCQSPDIPYILSVEPTKVQPVVEGRLKRANLSMLPIIKKRVLGEGGGFEGCESRRAPCMNGAAAPSEAEHSERDVDNCFSQPVVCIRVGPNLNFDQAVRVRSRSKQESPRISSNLAEQSDITVQLKHKFMKGLEGMWKKLKE
ncbi:hypothetical protein F5887DRAFT_916871 [Amanita rubescens]|nr:hypothetical protein F5887DRAFT_916871 [Amanita rubescens]